MEYEADRRLAQLLIQTRAVAVDRLHRYASAQRDAKAQGERPKALVAFLLENGDLPPDQIKALLRASAPTPPAAAFEREAPGRPPALAVPIAPVRTPRIRPWRGIGGYELVAPIASGGSGTVFKARDPRTGAIVAVKVLSAEGAKERGLERFLREAHVACRLRHENLVAGITVGTEDGLSYFVMEFVDGDSVGERLRREGRFGEGEALEIVRGVARALECARRHRIVHRDIKPDNVMIERDSGRVKLCDLGLARPVGRGSGVTSSGITVGTPRYISPEQARGDPDVDHRSDIYSLGITLYHMVVGEPPFHGDNGVEIASKHLYEDVPPARSRRPELSEGIDMVIARSTRKRPEDRYQTAAELVRDLDLLASLPPRPGALRSPA